MRLTHSAQRFAHTWSGTTKSSGLDLWHGSCGSAFKQIGDYVGDQTSVLGTHPEPQQLSTSGDCDEWVLAPILQQGERFGNQRAVAVAEVELPEQIFGN